MSDRPRVGEYMASEFVAFAPGTSIHDAIETLLDKGVSGAPVLDDGGNLVGILTTRDCLKIAFSASYHQVRGGPVSKFMSRAVTTVDASDDIVTVAGLFLEHRFHRFPVLRDNMVVGVVTRHKILGALRDLW